MKSLNKFDTEVPNRRRRRPFLTSFIYHFEVPLEEGFEILNGPKLGHQTKYRSACGITVSACSGWKLFKTLQGQSIKCWNCGCEADRWVADKGVSDTFGPPVLNLYGNREGKLVSMNQDHIIPRSLGGIDTVSNYRVACVTCNQERSNRLTPEEIAFRKANPQLIHPERLASGKRKALKVVALIEQKNHKADKDAVLAPFKAVGEL